MHYKPGSLELRLIGLTYIIVLRKTILRYQVA